MSDDETKSPAKRLATQAVKGIGVLAALATIVGVIYVVMDHLPSSSSGEPHQSDSSPSAPFSTPSNEPQAVVSTAKTSSSSPPAVLDVVTITEARIEVKGLSSDRIGVDLIDVDSNPDYEAFVYTAAGRSGREGCYVAWTLINNGTTLETYRSQCAPAPGFGGPFWPRVNYAPGSVTVTADITTDAGGSAHAETTFQMTER